MELEAIGQIALLTAALERVSFIVQIKTADCRQEFDSLQIVDKLSTLSTTLDKLEAKYKPTT
jgi:hypothetical protein